MSSTRSIPASEDQEPPSLNVLPELISDATPMSDASLNPTPAQDFVEKEYFTSKSDSKGVSQLDLPFRPNTTTSILASKLEDQKRAVNSNNISMNKILGHALNPANAFFNSKPFEPSTEGPCFANSAQAFWYRQTSSRFSKMLEIASYSPHLSAQYLDFFNHSIIPAFGPIHSAEAKWKPNLTSTPSPLKLSWNLCGQDKVTPNQQIHFSFEPVGPFAGTDEDAFNQLVPRFFVSALAHSDACPNLDLSLWHYFTTEFFVSRTDTQRISDLLPLNLYSPTCFLAFELSIHEYAMTLRPFLFPHKRALLDGKTSTETILSAIKRLHSSTFSVLPAIHKVESFLSAGKQVLKISETTQSKIESDDTEMSIDMLSFECVPFSQSPHVTLHLKTYDTSFSNIKRIYTLDGERPSPESDTALALFQQFWECLTGLEGEWRTSSEQTNSFLYFGLEITPGREMPDITIFVPAWTCGISQSGVRERLRNFFEARGWVVGKEFEEMDEGLMHTYSRFKYNEVKGVEVTMCYSPVMEKFNEVVDI
ncbi:hypothetical protein EG329_010885 [Mollisiaceae sp. DMI_Dod_QoI]|nr:hypothetical protein EG329_010885 [Helotiales sp. DMI_Dod_QoI]